MSEREMLHEQFKSALAQIPKEDMDLFNEAVTDINNLFERYPHVLHTFARMMVYRMTTHGK